MPFDMDFYSKFQQNPNYRLNLEDMVPESLKDRTGFLASGYQMHGNPYYNFVNMMMTAFYDSRAFDVGKPNNFFYDNGNQPIQPSYEADMWWSMAYTAYNNMNIHDVYERAKIIYEAFCHNYLYWTAKTGKQPYSAAFNIVDLQEFSALPSHIAIRFFFIAESVRLLYATDINAITTDQIRIYSEACLALATLSLPVYGFSTIDL
jgi:hypothetical protein